MPYDNIPNVGVGYGDGGLREPPPSRLPRLLVLGTAASGLTNELFRVATVREAEREFGATSEIAKGIHEALPQGAESLAAVRLGGRGGAFVATDSAAGALTITPEYTDNEIMDRYALAMEVNSGVQRIAVFDLVDQIWVHDSDEILVINEGIVEVVSTIDFFATGSFSDPITMTSLADLLTTDFTADVLATATMSTVVPTQGSDGTSPTLVERYAALNTTYHLLDFKDASFVVPMGVYVDDDNVADGDSLNLWAGPPLAGEDDSLGYVWQYLYQGKLYTYFADSATYFSVAGTAATSTINTDLVLLATRKGAGINGKVTLEVTAAAAGDTVTAVVTEVAGVIKIVVDVLITTGTKTNTEAAVAINAALAAFTMSNGLTADTFVSADAGVSVIVLNAAIAEIDIDNDTPGVGGNLATHEDLTGETIPAAVVTRATAGADVELREVNFAHQLASFCELASVGWSTMLGAISFKMPTAFGRAQIATWVGELPAYTAIGTDLAIDVSTDNGSGLLGFKYLAGAAGVTDGYRDHMVESGGAADGYAYGGFIKTIGASLPNGVTWPYGVLDSDEAVDANSAPVDIGKHIFVTYDWPVHRNAYNGGTPYRGSLPSLLLGKLSAMPENEEPIGINGVVARVTAPPRIHSTQIDALASIRAVGLRVEEGSGLIIVSAKTAAHPDSDYIRSSTIRSVNRELTGIRNIAKKFIGKAFNPTRLVALQSEIDGYLLAERGLGFHQGAFARLNYTRSDKILGRLAIELRMVPPFAIEQITVTTTLAADESEL